VYAFRVRAYLDGGAVGAWSNIVSTTVDQTAPTVTLSINRGVDTDTSAEATTNSAIRLYVTNEDSDPAVSWRWYEDGIQRSDWRPLGASHDVVLQSGDGIKKVTVEVRDAVGNVSLAEETITLNRVVTNGYRVTINNDDASTPFYTVNLQLSVPHTVAPPIAEMQLSTTNSFTDKVWVPFSLADSYTFDELGSNTYAIYARFRNVNGTITQAVLDTIYVDTTPPSVSVRIRSQSRNNVVLDLNGSDRGVAGKSGIVAMQVGFVNQFNKTAWIPFRNNLTISRNQSNRNATAIYVRYRDRAGNLSKTHCIALNGRTCVIDSSLTANQSPNLLISGTPNVVRHGVVALDNRIIKASDFETAANHLTYSLVEAPAHGSVLLGGRTLAVGANFTLNDLVRKRLAYHNNGATATSDRIVIRVHDAAGATTDANITIAVSTTSLFRSMLTHIAP
jgi:hypothetical protein